MSPHPASAPRNVRSWTDEQLRAAVAEHKAWRDVARALGLRPTSTHNLRRHVARLRLDTSHFTGRRLWTDEELVTAVAQAPSWTGTLRRLHVRDTSATRVRAKGHAARLGSARLGPVSFRAIPLARAQYDLLVTLPEGIRRVQVKSTTSQTAHGRWYVRVGHRPYSLDKSAGIDGGLYLVPGEVLAGRIGVYIDRYVHYRVGDASSLLE